MTQSRTLNAIGRRTVALIALLATSAGLLVAQLAPRRITSLETERRLQSNVGQASAASAVRALVEEQLTCLRELVRADEDGGVVPSASAKRHLESGWLLLNVSVLSY